MASEELLRKVHAAAIGADCDRDSLLAGLDPRFVASLPLVRSRAAQLWSDLNILHKTPRLADGTVPLVQWLEAARLLAVPRIESLVFEAALAQVRGEAPPVEAPRTDGEPLARDPASALQPFEEGPGARCFVSWHDEDALILTRLETHLAPLRRAGELRVWHRGRVEVGQRTDDVVAAAIDRADIVLLVVSADYLADNSSVAGELAAIMRRQVRGEVRVIPIVARSCDWSTASFSTLQVLPRDGRPILTRGNADEAYVEIVRAIRDVLRDRGPRAQGQTGALEAMQTTPQDRTQHGGHETYHLTEPMRGFEPRDAGDRPRGVGALPVGTPLRDIFKTAALGANDPTYVAPVQLREIQSLLRTFGNALLVEGPSRIGKSTAVRAALGGANATWIARRGDIRQLNETLDAEVLEGHLVIEDVHLLPPETMDRLADFIKMLADTPRPRGKVTLIGINHAGRSLAESRRDLAPCLDVVPMRRQSPEKLREIIAKGEVAANVRFKFASELATEACGSPRLVQQLCYRAAVAAEIHEVGTHAQEVTTEPSRIQRQVVEELDRQFGGPIGRFLRTDRASPTPGGCLALLWLLSIAREDEAASIGAARRRFSGLSSAFDWMERGELARVLEADAEIAELLHCDGFALRMQDPQLAYYLRANGWAAFGAFAGLTATVDSNGDLVIRTQGIAPDEARPLHFLDQTPYPFWDQRAGRLRDILIVAYDSVDRAQMLAGRADVSMTRWDSRGGIDLAWTGLLGAAALQGRVRQLVARVLEDPNVRAYHAELRALIRSGDLGW